MLGPAYVPLPHSGANQTRAASQASAAPGKVQRMSCPSNVPFGSRSWMTSQTQSAATAKTAAPAVR
ncbi:MAG: hypothetical protein AAGB93_17380 [Planctomycetota bacterium]